MPWPSRADYTQAVRDYPDRSLKDTKLEGGKPRRAKDNFLASYEGGWSIVFPIEKASKTFALRCWIKDVVDAEIRYQKISAHLAQENLPYFVDFEYVPEGIWVRGTKYPITRMEWANGLPLRAFIAQNLQEADVFRTVATEFQKMVAALHVHDISHGDLQDGNILLNRNGTQVDIKLIDYDSVFVPSLRGYPDSGIVGLPEYQHPQRIASGGQTGEKVDYFSELVIYLSFLSLAEKPELWNRFKDSTGDGLLFSADDFKNPNTSGVFGELGKLSTEVQALAARLKDFCAETSIDQLLPLEDILPRPSHEKCYERGMSYFRKGQDTYARAMHEFQKAIDLKSDFKEAYHSLGFTYLMTGKLDEAKAAAEKALAIDSNYQPARELLDAIRSRLVTSELRRLRRQNEELRTEKIALQQQLDDTQQRLRTETAELPKLQGEIQVLQTETSELRSQNRALQTEKAALEKELAVAQQRWLKATDELRGEIQVLQAEAAEFRTQNRVLQTETAELQTQNGALQEEKTALQQQFDRAVRRWITVIGVLSVVCLIAFFVQFNTRDEVDSQIGGLQQGELQTQEQLQKSQSQVAEKNAEIRGLKSASQKSAQREKQLRSQNRTLTNQNAALLKELDIERQQNRTLRDRIAALQKELDELRPPNRPPPPSNSVDANMALIPAGRFQMGSKNGEFDEKPVPTVYVDAFYIDKYEVTNAQYKKFVDANPEWRKQRIPRAYHNGSYLSDWNLNDYPIGKGEHPVIYVSWYAAMAYAQWAGKRLPTEAEWEKAARGGTVGQRYPWGNSIDSSKANYGTNSRGTTRVGNYPANNYGLYDMAGNVREWCLDAYQGGFYKSSHRRNPLAGSILNEVVTDFTNLKGSRVLRGGSWSSPARGMRVADRLGYAPTYAYPYVGFRCAKSATR